MCEPIVVDKRHPFWVMSKCSEELYIKAVTMAKHRLYGLKDKVIC